ncbi:MAG: SDR family NAD(P)-dependent oxidoreductase, partial [Saprospiraceae bacterium]
MKKQVVITGATKGLGRAIAEIFAENGFHICVCARTQGDLDDMEADWEKRFPQSQLLTFAADVGKRSEVMEFAAF